MNARIRLMMGGIAALGVVTAHGLAYALAEPDPHARHGLLEHTGHKWWTVVMAIGIGLGVVALGGLIDRWRQSSEEAAFNRRLVALWLALFQTGAFFGLESLERLLSGGNVLNVLSEAPVIIGVTLQLALVVVEVWLLSALAAGIRYLVAHLRLTEGHRRSAAFPILVGVPAPRPLVAAGGINRRGPPSPLGSRATNYFNGGNDDAKDTGRAWCGPDGRDGGSTCLGARHDPARRSSRGSVLQVRHPGPQRARGRQFQGLGHLPREPDLR